jgi:predicted ester cyclase
VKQQVKAFRTLYPDMHLEIKDVIVKNDKVVVRVSGSGTRVGASPGVEPNGAKVTWTAIVIGRFAGGKVVDLWSNEDALGRLRQLGVVGPDIWA